MPTVKIETGSSWMKVSDNGEPCLIECVSGSGLIVAAPSAPADVQEWGHSLNVGESVIANEQTFARAKPDKGDFILVKT
ncbi:MAG: hypothetical protein ACTINL_02380 [Serratia proteamaculans]